MMMMILCHRTRFQRTVSNGSFSEASPVGWSSQKPREDHECRIYQLTVALAGETCFDEHRSDWFTISNQKDRMAVK